MKKIVLTAIIVALFVGCSDNDPVVTVSGGNGETSNPGSDTSTGTTVDMSAMPSPLSPSALLSSVSSLLSAASDYDKQIEYDANNEDYIESMTFSNDIVITYSGSSASYTGSADGVSITINGADVVVNSTAQNVRYTLQGSSSDGMFKIYSTYKYGLTLNGVTLTNADGPALNLQSSKRAYVVVPEGTLSVIADGSEYAASTEDQKGAIFANGKILFSGAGTLNVTGNYKHAVASDDYIVTRYGITLNATANVSDALHANDGVYIRGGHINLQAQSNGMTVDKGPLYVTNGDVHVKSVNDALKTQYATAELHRAVVVSGGLLDLATTGEKAHGINAIDSVLVTGGVIIVSASGNASKGIKADGSFIARGGEVYLATTGGAYYDTTEKDVSAAHGLKCANFYGFDGNVKIAVSGKGAKGITSNGVIQVQGGSYFASTTGASYTYSNSLHSYSKAVKADGAITVTAGNLSAVATGGEKSEGIESETNINISGGWVMSYSYDDAINCAKALNVSGGNVYAQATNNDAIDSNGTINISGGLVVGVGASSPEEGIDTDNNSNFTITGGIVVGVGGKGMSCYPQGSGTSQYSVYYGGAAASGTSMALMSESDTLLILKTINNYSNDFGLLFSHPSLKSGTTYNLYSGGTISGGSAILGYYQDAVYSGGSALVSGGFTLTSIVTTIGNVSGGQGGGPGGQGGGPGGHGGGGFGGW